MMQLSESSYMPTSKESLTIYLPAEVKEKLAQIAKQEKRSMAFMGEQFIQEGIAAWEKKQQESKE